jgi:hypothetical protein
VTGHRLRHHRVRAGSMAVLVVCAVIGLSACGVPVDKQPAALSRHGIPFNLLAPTQSTTTTSTEPSPVAVPVEIFLIGPNGHLSAVARTVSVSPPDLATVLRVLVAGPTDTESAAGLQSAVTTQTTVLGANIAAGTATVNLGGTFGQIVGPQEIEAVSQVVFTASALPGVTGVTFQLMGQAVEVPVPSGALVPVATTAQFAALAP